MRNASELCNFLRARARDRNRKQPSIHEHEHEHDYEEGTIMGVDCTRSACFASCSRNTLINPSSCRIFISVSCFFVSSFSHDSFHQQNPITAGQRPENRSSSAFLAHSLASTFRW